MARQLLAAPADCASAVVDLLSAEDAQVHLRVGRATFFALIERHKVPKYKIPARGRRVFYKRSDIDRPERLS